MEIARTDVESLATAVGLCSHWIDAHNCARTVDVDDLIEILSHLGHEAETASGRRRSLERLSQEADLSPSMLTADAGQWILLPACLQKADNAKIFFEAGGAQDVAITSGQIRVPHAIGYHQLEIGGACIDLLISPVRCCGPKRRGWGPAIQIPSLAGPGAYGTFAELAQAAQHFAQAGAELVALSPFYALRPASGRFSPYSPSSRTFLNEALGTTVPAHGPADALIDWTDALGRVQQVLASQLAALTEPERRDFLSWSDSHADAHRLHAAYDILARRYGSPQHFPPEYRSANPEAVAGLLRAHPDAFEIILYGQYRAQRGLAEAQAAARSRGAQIGLVADLPVGVDPQGSDVWTRPSDFLNGLTIGAPPDPLGPAGQVWGLTSFAPSGLIAHGFRGFIDMIRTAFRYSGGIRVDHAFGLQRLWVIPEGRPSSAGAYLSYPVEDLMRIVALESYRHQAPVIAEDLGTQPVGFRDRMEARGLLGMKVLWFERDENGEFRSATELPEASAILSSTHDTATLAGWWRGVDLEGRHRVEPAFDLNEGRRSRLAERQALWDRIGSGPVPLEDATEDVVDAAISHLSQGSSSLLIVPLEDVVGQEAQVNVPGTTDEYPNWRRRMPSTLSDLLQSESVQRRLKGLIESRPLGGAARAAQQSLLVRPRPRRKQEHSLPLCTWK